MGLYIGFFQDLGTEICPNFVCCLCPVCGVVVFFEIYDEALQGRSFYHEKQQSIILVGYMLKCIYYIAACEYFASY